MADTGGLLAGKRGLIFGLANPYPFGLGRPAVYEAAIESGQFFLLLGILAGLLAVHFGGFSRPQRRELWLLVMAGSAWGAALACRISLLLAVAGVMLVTSLILAVSSESGRAGVAAKVACVCVPVLASGATVAAADAAEGARLCSAGEVLLRGRRQATATWTPRG